MKRMSTDTCIKTDTHVYTHWLSKPPWWPIKTTIPTAVTCRCSNRPAPDAKYPLSATARGERQREALLIAESGNLFNKTLKINAPRCCCWFWQSRAPLIMSYDIASPAASPHRFPLSFLFPSLLAPISWEFFKIPISAHNHLKMYTFSTYAFLAVNQ